MDMSFSLSDIIFIVLEAAILIAVVCEGWIGFKHYKHTVRKYQRYKAKRLIKKAFNTKEYKVE